MKEIKVLHLFNDYLPQTENWSYKLLKNTPSTQVFIGAMAYLKNNFYDTNFTFAEHPFGALNIFNATLDKRSATSILKKIAIKILSPILGTLENTILQFTKEHSIDIVHAHFADVAWSFKKIPQKGNKPFVISFYGWDYEQLPTVKPIFKKHYQSLFKLASAIICEGPHGVKILENMGCPPAKIKVVPLGVEPQQIPFFKREKREGQLDIVQIATFTEKKGQIYSIKAFAKALKTCPNMTLTLIGGEAEPGLKKEVIQYIKAKQLNDQIRIIEAIDYFQLYEYLKKFHLFIHPSCYAANRDCEGGAPVVLLDAQATGMPIVATRHCDIPQEVVDGYTGLLANEKDIDQLALHIRRFYRMGEQEYESFCNNARQHICEYFDIRQNAKKLREVYDTLL